MVATIIIGVSADHYFQEPESVYEVAGKGHRLVTWDHSRQVDEIYYSI